MNTSSSNFFLVHFRYMLPLFLAMIFFHVSSTGSSASAGNLINRVSASFDLEKKTLSGVSRISLNPDQGISLQTGALVIDEILINKESVDIPPDEDGLLVIPASSSGQEVVISYNKAFQESAGGQRSLLSDKGIVMLDIWYPLTMEESVIELTALIPNDFSAISEADDITTEQIPEGKKVHFSFTRPLSFVHFIAGPYVVEQEDFGDGKILTSYFFPEDKGLAAGYREKTKQYLERYEKLIGPYPYPRYSIVENRLPTGFAMPTFTLLGQSVVRLPFIVNTSLGHEVLHSWFGNAVNVDYEEGNWCEGLTTYLADHAFKEDKGEGAVFRKDQMVKYMSHVSADNEMNVMAFKSAGDHGPESQVNRAVGYNKTSMVFHMLRQKIGPEKFIEALRDFYEKNKYQYAGWKQLEEAFTDEASGVELESFFEQWLTGSISLSLLPVELILRKRKGPQLLPLIWFKKMQHPMSYLFRSKSKPRVELLQK